MLWVCQMGTDLKHSAWCIAALAIIRETSLCLPYLQCVFTRMGEGLS